MNSILINKHVLVHASDAGNGYHGYCKYCQLPYTTDLRFNSWEGTKCIDREVKDEVDFPQGLRHYANFCGFSYKDGKFYKCYTDEILTVNEMYNKFIKIKKNE